jgi:hypothetical protein
MIASIMPKTKFAPRRAVTIAALFCSLTVAKAATEPSVLSERHDGRLSAGVGATLSHLMNSEGSSSLPGVSIWGVADLGPHRSLILDIQYTSVQSGLQRTSGSSATTIEQTESIQVGFGHAWWLPVSAEPRLGLSLSLLTVYPMGSIERAHGPELSPAGQSRLSRPSVAFARIGILWQMPLEFGSGFEPLVSLSAQQPFSQGSGERLAAGSIFLGVMRSVR